MIKITNTPPVAPVEKKKKTGSSSASGADFKSFLGDAGEASDTQSADAAQDVNGFLFLQEISEEEVQRRKAYQKGKDTIQVLEQLHRDLLLGQVPEATLLRLESMVNEKRQQISDPRLMQLLDEIELRAVVELAKLGK